eukprot:TRINITY_DN46425_c0_g1_i1.p2 TRINITY_DN46425_c0_g1~~TRINITY_DN46425_c0_g1_i1.p2  ORF type:complete len:246 (-),score=32.67 TRINITY_DN46425_c0_g1_i1:276-1013(-)
MSPVIRIGVLALQGSFREHETLLSKIRGIEPVEVRTAEQLRSVHGLIIPGGESTTMVLVAERWGLIPELKNFAALGKPIWGTCAGLILLAENATGTKKGGQALLGGLPCNVHRNLFGAQIASFECRLPVPEKMQEKYGGEDNFRAVFIRAPGVLSAEKGVEVLAEYQLTEEQQQKVGQSKVIVGLRFGTLMATAFHPELTADTRWHQLFADMVRDNLDSIQVNEENLRQKEHLVEGYRPADLPVF